MAQQNPFDQFDTQTAARPAAELKPLIGVPVKPDAPTATFRPMTEAEKTAQGLDPKRVYQINAVTNEIKEVGGQPAPKPNVVDPNRVMKINSTLDALKNIRELANQTLSVGEQAGRVRDTPIIGAIFGQNRANLEGALSQVEGGLIQDQLAVLAQMNPQGVSSLANSETEARRLASSIANLDPNQSLDQFLTGVERAEKYYQAQLEQLGGKRAAVVGGENAGGSDGPKVTVTPEQSKAAFGQVSYDENGKLVGEGYEGGIYDSTGQYIGLVGSVSADPVNVQDQAAPSFYGSVANAVTGQDRATQITESLPDWTQMPEGSQLDWNTIKTALGTAFGGSPQEIAQIVQSNFPGTVVWQDAKGNYILRSAMDGKDYAIKPGFQMSDIPRALNIVGLGALTGGRTIGGTALREAGMQTVIEGGQSAVGGTFNPEDVLIAGGAGAAGKTIENAVPGALKMVRDIRGGGPTPPAGGAPRMPVAPTDGGGAAELNPAAAAALRGEPAPADPMADWPVYQPGDTVPGMRGGGYAVVDPATLRAQRAQELPVPIELARFQRSRLFEEQQRARELAKNNEVGAPIRARLAEQQEALRQNFDRFVDATGAEASGDLRETGVVVDNALSKLLNVSKARVRTLYKRAEKAGETQEPVGYKPLLDFIAEQTPTTREKLAPVLNAVQEQLAKNDPNGTGQIPINALEDVRKLINKLVKPGDPSEVYGRDMKGLIDGLTEGKGGALYQEARRARMDQAKLFENTAIIRDLMRKKPGTTDRAVALANVAEKAIWGASTSADDIKALKGTLDLASSRGQRAWRELQGATIEHIRDQAYKGVTRDETGQIVVSPAGLNTIITALDRAGKLDVVFDKKTAELLRTANSVAQDLFSAPPGAVNSSGTSSALLNVMDTLATYSVSGIPVPAGQLLMTFKKSLQQRGMKKEVRRLLD